MGLYENIKNAAKLRNITINQIEKDLGFPRSSIAKFNKNVPSVDKIYALANYLDVSIDYLINGKSPKKPHVDYLYQLDDRTLAFIEMYQNANPAIQDLVDAALKSAQHKP